MRALRTRIAENGSPGAYATWQDESINAWLKNLSSAAHRSVFSRRVLSEFYSAYGLGAATKAAKRSRIE